jgi:DNA repair protein RecN (Recombination protein N)
MKRKYGPALDDVIAKGIELRREHDLLRGEGATATELEAAVGVASRQFLESARELSTRRRAAAKQFAGQLEQLLAELAMDRTRFEVRFEMDVAETAWGERGIDQAEFFVSPNPGEDLRPLSRIVSGGELSRVMLALKTMSVEDQHDKTLIFDEVDAGIGGRVADVVGSRLQRLGDRFQVLCITHLPQIASRGATHFHIDKAMRGSRTVTSVRRLSDDGRIEEIGRMIGGAVVTDQARASAKELLAGAVRGSAAAQAKAKQNTKGESETPRGKGRHA